MIEFIKDLYICWVLTVYKFEMATITKVISYCCKRSNQICKKTMKITGYNKKEEGLM